MKKTFVSLSLFLCLTGGIAQVGTLAEFGLVFPQPGESNSMGFLPPGTVVQMKGVSENWKYIEGRGLKGWTRGEVVTISSEWKITQSQELVVCPAIFLDENTLALWWYKKQLWWFDIDARKVVRKEAFDDISEILGLYRQRWLVYTISYFDPMKEKPTMISDMWVYDIRSKKKIQLGIFDDKKTSFEGFLVSPDHRYALVRIRGKNHIVTHVLDLSAFRWVSWVTNVSQPQWYGTNQIIFRTKDTIVISDLSTWLSNSGSVDGEALLLPKGVKNVSSFRIVATNIYILAEKKIYRGRVGETNWEVTDFRSFDWNSDQTLNFYVDSAGGHMYDLRRKKLIPEFSGENPVTEFIGFTLEGVLIQKNFAKIPTIFLLTSQLEESYRYKAIDKIHASDGNGTLLEVIDYVGELLIAVEKPGKGYYFIFPRRL
ncbi:hypothetical protein [Thermospira aquatica]|uniref:SH3 domain-containing protein n=1 Tax=Thermospira aquatica TaxID=2828656 RepID=A0AAX3BC44_9SPIR|nr:hypothetical protein [Thermospira aquatica]URA09832.1 hypothetical protein KDW03_10160 [Thermospira aquatica]